MGIHYHCVWICNLLKETIFLDILFEIFGVFNISKYLRLKTNKQKQTQDICHLSHNFQLLIFSREAYIEELEPYLYHLLNRESCVHY